MKILNIQVFLYTFLSVTAFGQVSLDWKNTPKGTIVLKEITGDRTNKNLELSISGLIGEQIKSLDFEYNSKTYQNVNKGTPFLPDQDGNLIIDIKGLLQSVGIYATFDSNKKEEFHIKLTDNNSSKGGGQTDNIVKLTYILRAIEDDVHKDDLQIDKQAEISQFIKLKYGTFANIYTDKKNNIIKAGNTVHIFLDEYGKTYFTSLPTTAREDFNYQFHVFYYPDSIKGIILDYDGTYDPSFDIYGTKPKISLSGTDKDVKDGEKIIGPQEIAFGKIGPFSNTFTFTIKKTVHNPETNKYGKATIIAGKTIRVAKVHHISITAGLISSSLSNPTDFEKYPLAYGDTTIIANDPLDRGLITLMVTFYPMPRNLLFAPTNWKERIGFVVGTRIDKNYNENFLCGVSFDIARGASLTGGLHYGRVNRLASHSDFNYGKDKFVGELKTKMQWELGTYIGVNIDLRVFELLFNPQKVN
ncbi:MAG TPA: hypothetical protein DCR40_16300 [Prolixibacteraceae bacterium]|nr:hypothetical protein [Prolixibacteraceae bacterium]